MFTLQILDAGQSFQHTLGPRSTTFGSSEDADVRLHAAGVAATHARLEPHDGGVRLIAHHDVVVNGAVTREADLSLGDRVEIGEVVVIVGRVSARKATPAPKPELQVATAPRPSVRAPSRRPSRSSGSKSKAVAVFMVLLAVGGVAWMALLGDDAGQARSLIAMVDDMCRRGKVEEARAESGRLRQLWSDAEDDRLSRLDAVDATIAAIDTAREELRGQVLDLGSQQTYASWSKQLRGMEGGVDVVNRVAARKVRSRLRELINERDERASARSDVAGRPSLAASRSADQQMDAPPLDPGRPAAPSAPAPVVVAPPSVEQAEVDRRCDQGQYAQALALVQAGFETVADADEVARLRAVRDVVRERATRAMTALLGEVKRAEEQGRLEGAAEMLGKVRHQFPSGAAFQPLRRELARLDMLVVERQRAKAQAAVAVAGPVKVDQATRLKTLASLRSHMDKIRDAEEAGDYAAAAALLRDAAGAVRSRDAEFADRLVTRAAESDLLSGWNDAVVAALQSGKQLTTTDMSGRELELLRVDDGQIIARSVNGDARLEWFEVDAAGMQRLASAIRAKGRTSLGLAALLYKNGESEAAEDVLAELIRSNAKQWQAPVNEVLARGRGEQVGAAAYELRKGEFVSMRQVALEERSKKLVSKLQAALRSRDPGARDAFVQSTVAEGDISRAALGLAARELFEKDLRRVESSSLKKQVDNLAAEREQLDAARAHAKELVFDEVKYFYPYKPPAVSGDKHAEYNRVQQEVDERIAALRKFWQGSKTRLRVPAKFGDDLERVDWLAEQMGRLGALPKGSSIVSLLQPIAWARALEPGETLTLQTFCLTPSERAQRAYWRQTRAYNEAAKGEWPVAVTALLRITNDYREMFGHRPLAAVKSACEASQGHADEMSKLGYFAHMSPTPGRKTPTDRMRLAGYMFGVSENIAMTGGAMSSHVAWCHSSGHHRNLLSPNHREIGIGANGRYWVQNFGSGDVHKSHPLWAGAAEK